MRGLCVFVAACAVIAGGAGLAGGGATDIERYAWTNVRPTAPFDPTMWSPRAGLQAVELRDDLYIMGGRGPFSFETETVLYGDVWKCTDLGATWTRTAIDAWPARGYFGAVNHQGRIFVMGGQNFSTRPNPIYPDGCSSLPPGVPCLPFLPDSRASAPSAPSALDEFIDARVASSNPACVRRCALISRGCFTRVSHTSYGSQAQVARAGALAFIPPPRQRCPASPARRGKRNPGPT